MIQKTADDYSKDQIKLKSKLINHNVEVRVISHLLKDINKQFKIG